MTTLLPRVRTLIQTAVSDAASVFHAWPASWTQMPCVAYREEENRQFRRADGAEALCEVIYALDVWSLSAQEARDLLDEVDAALCAEGFARTQTQSLFEEKTRFYHLCARYRALTDGTNLFQ